MTAAPFVDRTGDDDTTWQAELARIEAAPACEEGAVERVARAMWDDSELRLSPEARIPWSELAEGTREGYRRFARAALAAMKPAVTR